MIELEAPIEISPDQLRYFQAARDCPEHDIVLITGYDRKGWLFVENSRDLGTDGSGVWLDTSGRQHYGPGEIGHDVYGIHP